MDKGKVYFGIVIGILVMLLSSGISVADKAYPQGISGSAGSVNVSNSFIKIVVNPQGSYTMGTTGGNPATSADDNKNLLFGYPSRLSSHMTAKIDGTDYYTSSSALDQYRVSGPTVSGNSIITTWRVADIGITQTIAITTSSTTGREDTALFKVAFTNNGNAARSVGARFLFDTMLGSNDAAPFRVVGIGDVTTEREFNGSNIPAYWQAFDSLSNPTVISQGTLTTPPDRFIMANWANLDVTPWNYSVRWGSSIGDSATAVYWNPVSIQPGRTIEYATAYGLGGVTVTTQGVLSLGITSPVNVTVGDNFTITAYLQNTGTTAINNIAAVPDLPAGIALASGETSQKSVGTLAAGASTQVFWNARAVASGNYTYYITLTSSNAPSVSGNRSITIAAASTPTISQPDLMVVSFGGPSSASSGSVIGSNITLTIKNNGNAAAGAFFVDFVISDDSTITTSDTLLTGGRESVSSLAAGATTTVILYSGASIPASVTTGSKYLGVILDPFNSATESNETNNLASSPITLVAPTSTEADKVILVGDIDNLGFGWPAGFDVFSGRSTPAHSYPYQPETDDPQGTDRIMLGTSYNGNPPAGQDGYTSTTSRPANLPQAIDMQYDLLGTQVRSATLQMFVDDFQSPLWRSRFQVTLNGQRATFLEDVLNTLEQTGPIGKLITAQVPASFLPLVSSGHLTIYIDDPTTGAGDGFAIDFVRLLINPRISTVGNISGRVTDAVTGLPLTGATVSASGIVAAATASDGSYILNGVPAGLVVVNASKNGYTSQSQSIDLVAGTTVTLNFALRSTPTTTPTVTPTPIVTPIPTGTIRQWASGAAASSEYTTTSWSAAQATGAPDTITYGDIATAWATLGADDGVHWIELSYNTLVYATGVNVRETYNPGALTRIDLKDSSGIYQTVWTGRDTNTGIPDRIGWSNITFAQTTYPTNTVKLYLNTSLVPGWNEIDAVELVGIYAGITPLPTPTPAAYRLSATPAMVSPGESITVTFTAPGFQSDWISIYPIGEINQNYDAGWQYLGGRTSGTLTYTAPSTPGEYEFRMFQDWSGTGSYNDIARSNRITVVTATVTATPPPPITTNANVSNSYIDIVVEPSGKYTMATTGGNPDIRTDDNQLLLFGYPSRYTSYLTVRIDGVDYYYIGLDGYKVSGPSVSGNSIITSWRIGDISVTQKISITTSSTTGREDTALFKVSITNNGNAARSAGARFLFDTMLGSNDAAPFRVPGVGDVTTEREFNGSNVPTSWQAFDSLTNPSVISQGTLATSTPPNRFIMANWGNLYHAPWYYEVQRDSSNGDSATAVYWNPVSLLPGRTVEYSTAYGLGGLTVSRSEGVLSLGITSPTNVESRDAFTVTAYIQNTGSTAVNNLNASIIVPPGLALVPGEMSGKSIGTLASQDNTQVSWNLQATGTGAMNFSVSVSASNAAATSASRTINVAPVRNSTASVTRSIAPSAIQPGSMLNITLTPSPAESFDFPGYQVAEIIPQGFTYVGTEAAGVTHAGSVYTFTQIGSAPITYTLTAPSTGGSYTISGTFKDEFKNTGAVSGTAGISVGGGGTLTSRYDANGDGRIQRNEAVAAVMDYFSSIITRQQAIEVVMAFFSGG